MWTIFIDVSGMPPEDIYVGMFLMNYNYKPGFLTDFYGAFPDLKHYRKKSTHVKKEKLTRVLEFFDAKRFRMACYHFSASEWTHHESRINQLMQEINPSHTYKRNIGIVLIK